MIVPQASKGTSQRFKVSLKQRPLNRLGPQNRDMPASCRDKPDDTTPTRFATHIQEGFTVAHTAARSAGEQQRFADFVHGRELIRFV